jgi:hypothetical protein
MSVCKSTSTISTLHAELAFYLERAYENAGCPSALGALSRCLYLIDAMALTTTEYGLMRNRLHNARRYSEQAEWGAARFELRLLMRPLAAAP